MALRNNKQMGVAKMKQEVNANLRKSARTQYLPKVNALGGYMWMSREISILNDDENVYAYRRVLDGTTLTVFCNWTEKTVPCPLKDETKGELLISNYALHKEGVLQPYEAIVKIHGNCSVAD